MEKKINKRIRGAISNLCFEIKKAVLYDFKNDNELFHNLFKSYNFYQEVERNGVDYIFDIRKKDEMMSTDLSMDKIVKIFNNFTLAKTTPYFFYGENYEQPKMIKGREELELIITSNIDEIIEHIIANPNDCESHSEIYNKYVWENLIEV